jgi:hypothetical protein
MYWLLFKFKMADEVYFNEPGFENEAGAAEGEKKNEEMQIL